jgi:hypothetical protein
LSASASPLTQGKKATGVPDVQLNLGAEGDASFLRGLSMGAPRTFLLSLSADF